MDFFSVLIIPAILALFGIYFALSKKDTQEAFITGAKEGFSSGISLIPALVILMTAVSMFSASGAAELISSLLEPVMSCLGIPSELTPLLIIRPISGSGSTALLSDLLERYGADSFVSKCASVLMASSDTMLYVVSVYTSSCGVKKTRHILPVATIVMVIGIFLSCITARLLA